MSTIRKGWMLAPVLAAVGAAVTTGYGPAGTASCPAQYVISAAVGMPLAMYSQDQFASQHPTAGEVMLHGQMSGMSGSSASGTASPGAMGSSSAMGSPGAMGSMGSSGMMGPGGASSTLRHLEVYIHSKATGVVVQDANPRITVTDTTAGGAPQDVPVVVMEGIGATGKMVPETLHYGNNVTIPAGHRFTTLVTAGCQTASFDLTSPGTAAATTAPPTMSGMSPAPGTPPSTAMSPAPTPQTGVFLDRNLPTALGFVSLGAVLIAASRRRRRAVARVRSVPATRH